VSDAPAPPRRRLVRRLGAAAAVVAVFLIGLWLGGLGGEPQPAPAAATSAGKAQIWTCSMHPQIQLPEPGKCPICGMDLIPLESSDQPASEFVVELSERAKHLAQIRTAPVERGQSAVDIRLLGRLEEAETRRRSITAWIAGRIDNLYVSSVGARIGKGQVIGKIYSPEIYAAHQDLISAKRQVRRLNNALPVTRSAAEQALEAARQRLRLAGLRDAEIAKMEDESRPRQHVNLRASEGGTVLEQLVNEGTYVSTGTVLYKVASLSELWVQLDAYEQDLSRIRKGQTVLLEVATFPGETFEGKVAFIDAVIDPRTRTAQVRVEVPNKDHRLSPGMFAEAVLQMQEDAAPQPPLMIPHTAPLFTGTRSVVYVQVPDAKKPTYHAREVQLGPRAGHFFPVVSGLEQGERVVVEGAFALDSELQIRGGASMMTASDDVARQSERRVRVPAAVLSRLSPVLQSGVELSRALAGDELPGAKKAAAQLATRAAAFDPGNARQVREVWKDSGAKLEKSALRAANAKNLDDARLAFQQVSEALLSLLASFGNPLPGKLKVAFCPMAAGGKGAHWLTQSEKIENPYFGAKMLRCGEFRQTLEPKAHLEPLEPQPVAPKAAPGGHQH
jgi:Cu(I)/Ag(I) efflux system membrane fusion protein